MTPHELEHLNRMGAQALALYSEVIAFKAMLCLPQAAAPVISTLSTPEEIANPITQIRMGLKMSRAVFALHIGLGEDAIKKAERGIPRKLHSSWEPALERAGHSARKVFAQYIAWRAQMASTEFVDDKITPLVRAN